MRAVITVGMIFYTIIAAGVYIYTGYTNSRDLDSWVNRAQVAANHTDMIEYMEEYQTSLVRNNLTTGHTAILMTKPDNDLALHYRAVENIIDRLVNVVSEMDTSSPEYQTAIDDLRGTCRELEYIASDVTWVHLHWLIWIGLIGWIVSLVSPKY